MTSSRPSPPPAERLTLLSREGCLLCEEMLEALQGLGDTLHLPPVEVVDVDADPLLARRYGLDIPVLLLDGVKVCEHHLDEPELRRLLRAR